MLYNYSEFAHSLGLCFWDLPALLAGAVMIVMFAVHKRNQKKREEDFESRLRKNAQADKEEAKGGGNVKA